MYIYKVHIARKNVKELSTGKRVATTRAALYAQGRRSSSITLLPYTTRWP
jgi:hypothetical protein